MSVFEFLVTLYAIVAGLGVSLLVRSIGQMIEARDRLRLYWVHSGWIVLTFVGYVVSWFGLWQYAGHHPWTILQALLLLSVPILLYLISHLAVPELEDDRIHDMREYYFKQARWLQGLLLAVLVAAVLEDLVIAGRFDFGEGRGVRAAMAVILIPGLFTSRPAVHAVQTAMLLLIISLTASFILRPIG